MVCVGGWFSAAGVSDTNQSSLIVLEFIQSWQCTVPFLSTREATYVSSCANCLRSSSKTCRAEKVVFTFSNCCSRGSGTIAIVPGSAAPFYTTRGFLQAPISTSSALGDVESLEISPRKASSPE